MICDIVEEITDVDAMSLVAYPVDVVAHCHKAAEKLLDLRNLVEETAEQISPPVDVVERASLIMPIQEAMS